MSSAGIPLRQRSPHIDIVHLYKARCIGNRHSAPCWHWSHHLGYWISMLKLNAPAEIHWRRSNMNKRDPILMKSVEVLKDCRSLNAADEMNCLMPRSVEKVPVRNEKRCSWKLQSYNFVGTCFTPSGMGKCFCARSQKEKVQSEPVYSAPTAGSGAEFCSYVQTVLTIGHFQLQRGVLTLRNKKTI